ncbi:XRE family transcriptional regulator [Lysinibacillus sp.]|uniref:XRE family transcriptional regulator n=1 Tax=Lysinibacillus sp. TaxID=1869345 RepID=UPI0028A97AC0|nr:XRE family transcriptional regulator [Lysinibacillus sp.]
MTVTAVGEIMKGLRGDDTQLQWGFDMGVVRETVSKYETGRSKVPADIGRKMMDKYDDPKLAMAIQYEYTGTGPRWLDGQNVDLHRCSVREKTIEELEEALVAIKNTSMSKPAFALTPKEREEHKKTLEEIVELITAATNYIAVGTDYIGISYSGVWNEHYNYLQQEGFIK